MRLGGTREQNGSMVESWRHQVLHRTDGLVVVLVEAGSTSRATLTRAGQFAVHAAVEELMGSAAGEIAYTDLGAPEWLNQSDQAGQRPVHISIAHTGSVAVGVASTTTVGIDLERSDRDVSRLFRGLNEVERQLVPRWSVLEILCAKEAAGKAQNIGLAGSVKRWHVSEVADQLKVNDVGQVEETKYPNPDGWAIDVVRTRVGSIPLTCVIAMP